MVAVDGGYGDIFGGAAVDGVADGSPAVTEVSAADAAPLAVAAEQGWVNRDAVALADEVDVGTTATTSPANSWPGMIGKGVGGNRPAAMLRSDPQIPTAPTRITTSLGPGVGSGASPTCIDPGWL